MMRDLWCTYVQVHLVVACMYIAGSSGVLFSLICFSLEKRAGTWKIIDVRLLRLFLGVVGNIKS